MESTFLAVLFTIVPILVLVLLYFMELTRPLYLIGWLALALGWTSLLTTVYLRRVRKGMPRRITKGVNSG